MGEADREFPSSFGPFVLLRLLGAGGMGSAYLAQHSDSNRLLVVKRMHPELLGDASIFKRFVHEAEVAHHVRHANVAGLVAMGTVGREPFLAMEYVFGISVAAIVGRMQDSQIEKIPLGVGLCLSLDLARGIEAIHEARHLETGTPLGLIHRDVSSRNVLVGFDGVLRVIDLGLGKSILSDWHTASQVLAGSPDYMPPEQAAGERVDARADVYSAAVTIWEMLAGRKRIQEDGVAARLARAMEAEPERLLPHRPKASRALEALLMQSMATRPEERSSTSRMLREGLEREFRMCKRPVTRADVIAWLDVACATVIARERRTLEEACAKAALHRGPDERGATQVLVGHVLGQSPGHSVASETPLEVAGDHEQEIQGQEIWWLNRSMAILMIGVFLALGVSAILRFGDSVDSGELDATPALAGSKSTHTPEPDLGSLPVATDIVVPADAGAVAPLLQDEGDTGARVKVLRAIPPEVQEKKLEMLGRIRELRRVRFDVAWQRRLTRLGVQLSQARTQAEVEDIGALLARMESERRSD